jgi:hypothetical protein
MAGGLMAEGKTRKPMVPNLDRVCACIAAGEYDGELDRIRDAMKIRNRDRENAVMKLVKEVFGDEAEVLATPSAATESSNPFVRKAQQAREHQEPLPGPYRADPVTGATLRAAGPPDSAGFLDVTDIFGGHETRVLQSIWVTWTEVETGDEDEVKPDSLSGMDAVERQMMQEDQGSPPGRGGAMISGLSSSDIAG